MVYRSILHKPGPAAATAALGHTPGARSKHGPAVRVENTERYPDSDTFKNATVSQGLTLVHYAAQPEPFLTRNTP